MGVPLSPQDWDNVPWAHDGKGYHPGDWKILYHVTTGGPHGDGQKCPDWDNCQGHLYFCLPCGCLFDAGGRASNCTMPNDRKHRCWVVEGQAPHFSLTKNGSAWPGGTCQAGAGSIGHTHWHGFLRNGVLE